MPMISGRSLPLAAALTLAVAEAVAQAPGSLPTQVPWLFSAQVPGQFPPAPGQLPGQAVPAPPAMGRPTPCVMEFRALREAAQERANSVRAASGRKATPAETCKLIGYFADAEAKVVSYVEKNATSCGIPAEAVKNIRLVHGRSLELRKRVCTAAAQAPQAPWRTDPPLRDDRLYPVAPASWDAAVLPDSKGY